MGAEEECQVWQQRLYILQQHAPSPKPVRCIPSLDCSGSLPFSVSFYSCDQCEDHAASKNPLLTDIYGDVYHGALRRQDVTILLQPLASGTYLIRDCSQAENAATLVIKFDEEIKNFRLFFDVAQGEHFVGENRFQLLNDLVADGLIHFYVETRGADVIEILGNPANYQRSPYVQEREQYYTLQNRRHKKAVTVTRVPSSIHSEERVFRTRPKLSINPLVVSERVPNPSLSIHLTNGINMNISSMMKGLSIPVFSKTLTGSMVVHKLKSKSVSSVSILEDLSKSCSDSIRKYSVDAATLFDHRGSVEPAQSVTELRLQSASLDRSNNTDQSAAHVDTTDDLEDEEKSAILGQNLGLEYAHTTLGKAHNFKQLTFAGPQWCDLCTHFMWGLVQQGVRCQDCGMQAHKKCGESAPRECIPDMKLMKRVFGVELNSLVLAEHGEIPKVLVRLVTVLESRKGSLQQEGIYRECGNHDRIEELKAMLNKDVESVNFANYTDDNIITGLIKKFFTLLPIPLITFELYTPLVSVMALPESDEKIRQVRIMLRRLPETHKKTLQYFLAHLRKVVENQDVNRMNSANLSVIFSQTLLCMPESSTLNSPTLRRGMSPTLPEMNHLKQRVRREQQVVQYLIDQQTALFSQGSHQTTA